MSVEKLKELVPFNLIQWRTLHCWKNGERYGCTIAPYLKAEGAQEILDRVVGPENWKDCYAFPGDGVVCTLSIRIGNEWVSKTDGASGSGESSFKAGISGALVRAASKWGVGRHLKLRGAKIFGEVCSKGDGAMRGEVFQRDNTQRKKVKIGEFYWRVPRNTQQLLGYAQAQQQPPTQQQQQQDSRPEPDAKNLQDLMRKAGVSTKEEADKVSKFVTSGKVKGVDHYKQSTEAQEYVAKCILEDGNFETLLARSLGASDLEAK